jgi:acyl transferase domain-containing protein
MRVLPAGAGTAFTEEANGRSFRLDRTQRSDYQRLFERLAEEGTLPEHLIHCSSLTSADEVPAGAAGFQEMQERGLYTLLFLLQAYEQQTSGAALRVTLFSNNIQAVTGQETLWPEKSPLLGLAKVAAQENPDVLCRCIDLEGLPETAEDYEPLLAEVLSRDNERTLAYRQGQRWSEAYTPEKVIAPTSLPFRSQGVYLITGGLGGVGLLLARELAQRVQARLVLVGRVGLPPRAEWTDWLLQHTPDDVTSRRIHLVQALEALGSSVLVCQADCADQAQMRTVIDQTIATFGELHGVIHAAGVSDSRAFGSVQELGREIYDWHFGPKVHGLYALQEVLSGYTLDFCVLFSSLSTILGGLGLAAYTAANRFMDAFAALHNRETAQPWICVNWDSWHVKERPHGDLGATIAVFTMDHEEGTDAFTRVLTAGKTHLVHSTGDLEARIRQWVYLDSLGGADTHHETTGPAPVPADYERILSEIWRQTLGLEQVGLTDNFFDLGGNSLTALQLISRIRKQLQVQLPAVAIFEAPTISAMVAYLKPEEDEESRELELLAQRRTQARQGLQRSDIAIIGMSGRFPGASSIDAYWQNLRNGVEALTYFSEEELLASGLDPALINDPAYVRARPVLKPEEVETFDAAFFGYSPREAELTDPQHRVFLECCWEALEMAGYDAERYPGMIGMFGGTNISSYILALTAHPELLDGIMDYQLVIGNDKDSLATGISYKMNLKGPSLSIQTFCSTSLVATHLACQSLLNGECDLALAGGVSLRIPTRSGYLYQEGGQESTDGHCYTFDARATGSNFGDGAGVVVLKRLADALADGDTIHAVIKGSAINNDGSLKVSYTAPSVNGQAEVVLRALEHAGVSAESITYVEAHGTATELGDPIEVASLTKAYRTQTRLTNFCAIGSVKTNVGHMDRASGVSGLIKVIEALKHHEIPASLNFESPNPAIDFANSPFYVNTSLTPWPRYGEPRRAAVNSLGMGGTNAHVIVEEAPEVAPSGPTRPAQILLLSARTPTALQAASQRLRDYMQNHPTVPLADIAYTLQIGRKQMEQRTMLVCQSREDALDQLANVLPVYEEKRTDRPVAFLFSGVGEQYAGMAGDLYEREAVFRECIDQCCTYLRQRFQLDLLPLFTESFTDSADTSGLDLRAMLGRGEGKTSSTRLSDPVEAQCSTFILEYALTRLLRSWGVRPQALLGYSLGEYLAATVAGVFSLEDALSLVVQRARLIAPLASGGMLAVFAPAEQVQTFLQPTDSLEIAIFTSPTACVLAGPTEGLLALSERLNEAGIVNRRVANGQAFHSSHMHEVREQLTRLVEATPRQVPSTPYLSNVTGEWITAELAQDASYWARHLCEPVRFSQCVERLLSEGEWILVEVGIGQLLSGAVKQHPACTRERAGAVIATLPSIYEQRSTQAALLRSLGQIWLHGGKIDWSGFSARERRQRVPLPTYPFERQRYWLLDGLKGRPAVSTERMIAGEMEKIENLSDWFFVPTWTRMPWPLPTGNRETTAPWLLFMDECGVSAHIRERLLQRGTPVIAVYPGASYAQRQMREFQVRPAERDDYNTLLQTLARQGLLPERLVHCWSVTGTDETDLSVSALSERGFYSLLATAQALGNLGNQQFQIDVISTDMQDVTGNEALVPIKALLTGPCKVIQQEYNHIRCRSIDLAWDEWSPQQGDALYKELLAPLTDTAIALRGRHRWVQTYEPLKLAEAQPEELPLRQEGVYLIIGGLGGIGLALAEHLARTVQARLVLVGRTGLPARSQWDELLQSQGSETGIGRRIQQVQMIESLGAHVLPIAADIADEEQMQAVIDLTLATFGALHGIIHAAALPPSGLIQLKSPAQAAAVLAPKVQGTLVLERILAKQELDFLLFFSSMSSSTGGGPGQVDYCAANAFLDAFAHKHSNDYGMTIAIDWGEWLWDAWADGLEGFPPEVRRYFIEKRRDYGISFTEGMEAMTRILARRLTHVVVATQDFPRMVEGSKSFSIDAIIGAVTTLRKMQATAYPRPALSTPYVAPETELEEEIVQIWGELLGIEQIGIHDNFFELGGHSLIGSQLIARLRQSFQVNLSLELIFESATVAELAAAIELALIEEIEQADTSTVA